MLLLTQLLLIYLYMNASLPAAAFTKELTILNIIAPLIVFLVMMSIAFKFSGSPLRSAVYSQKLKYLQWAIGVWSIARFIRGIGGMYESSLFNEMLLGLESSVNNSYFIPMLIIVVFLLIEILPIMFVLDWNFMEIFVTRSFPITATEPLFEHQHQN